MFDIPNKKRKLANDMTNQVTNNSMFYIFLSLLILPELIIISYTFVDRWSLIQRCLVALEDCIKRFPQHYKSYYRLAHFYFRSQTHKDCQKFKNLMFGEQGLFVGQRPNNFFHVSW